MSLAEEIEALRRHLDRLASDTDDELIERYELRRPPMPPGLYWRLRWLAGWAFRWLQSKGIWRSDPWPVALKQVHVNAKAKPLLIWAIETDRDALRAACERFSSLWESLPEFAPVLVTDVADFAFFSRLGWLVEYLPQLAGEGEQYDERKARFLARLYQGVPALPLSAALASDSREAIRRYVTSGATAPSVIRPAVPF